MLFYWDLEVFQGQLCIEPNWLFDIVSSSYDKKAKKDTAMKRWW